MNDQLTTKPGIKIPQGFRKYSARVPQVSPAFCVPFASLTARRALRACQFNALAPVLTKFQKMVSAKKMQPLVTLKNTAVKMFVNNYTCTLLHIRELASTFAQTKIK